MKNPIEVTEAEKVILFLVAAFPSANVTADTIAVYVEMLSDLEPDLLKLAAKKAVTDSRFFPTVNELREAVAQLITPPSKSGAEQWGKVVYAAITYGPDRGPGNGWDFADPITRAAVESLGWRNVCLEDEGVLMWPFIKAYDSITKRRHDDARQLPAVKHQIQSLSSGRPVHISGLLAAIPTGRLP